MIRFMGGLLIKSLFESQARVLLAMLFFDEVEADAWGDGSFLSNWVCSSCRGGDQHLAVRQYLLI